MKKMIGYPIFGLVYFCLLITSFVARTMAVISATCAAGCVNVALWSGAEGLINKLMKEKQ